MTVKVPFMYNFDFCVTTLGYGQQFPNWLADLFLCQQSDEIQFLAKYAISSLSPFSFT